MPVSSLPPQKFSQNLLQQKAPAAKCNSHSLAKLETSVNLCRESGPAVPQCTYHGLHPSPVVLKLLWFGCLCYISQQKETINLCNNATDWCLSANGLEKRRKCPELVLAVKMKISNPGFYTDIHHRSVEYVQYKDKMIKIFFKKI